MFLPYLLGLPIENSLESLFLEASTSCQALWVQGLEVPGLFCYTIQLYMSIILDHIKYYIYIVEMISHIYHHLKSFDIFSLYVALHSYI